MERRLKAATRLKWCDNTRTGETKRYKSGTVLFFGSLTLFIFKQMKIFTEIRTLKEECNDSKCQEEGLTMNINHKEILI